MKHLYLLIIFTVSFSVYSQGYMTWNFQPTTDANGNVTGTAFGAQASESSYINADDAKASQAYLGYMGSSFVGNDDGTATAPKGLPKSSGQTKTATFSQRYPNTVKKDSDGVVAGDAATSPQISSGKVHISVAFKEWLMSNDSDNTFEIKIRSFDNGNNPATPGNQPKTILSLKLEQVKTGQAPNIVRTPNVIRVVGQTWNNTQNGQFRNAGELPVGSGGAVWDTPTHIGATIDYDTNSWEFWTNSPGDTSGFATTKGGISGTIASANVLPIAPFDHMIVNIRRPAGGTAAAEGTIGTEDYWIVDQIKVDTGTYTNTLSTDDLAKEDSFTIYPNPADDFIFIENLSIDSKVELVNVAGKKIKSFEIESHNQRLNISGLNSGVYFVKVDDKAAVKFIKR